MSGFITAEEARRCAWAFGRGDGSVIAAKLHLGADGRIVGSVSSNEASWREVGGCLEFLDRSGRLTTRFDTVTRDALGRRILEGRFLLETQTDVVHTLRELATDRGRVMPRVAVLVRTHLVNDKLHDLLRILAGGVGYDLFVCGDESRGALAVPGHRVVGHSVAMCAELRLVGALPGENVLWYFGDYAFYCAHHVIPDYDHYVLIEYDVDLVRGNALCMEGLIHRLRDEAGDYDLVASHYGVPGEGWDWARTCEAYFRPVYSVLFPFVVLSNRAVRYLYDWRLHEARHPPAGGRYAFCEALVPSALNAAGGFRCADLDALMPGCYSRDSFRVGAPMLLGALPALGRGVEWVHPVFAEREYLERSLQDARDADRVAEFIARLQSSAGLPVSAQVRRVFLERAARGE